MRGARKELTIVQKTAKRWQKWDFILNFQIILRRTDREWPKMPFRLILALANKNE